jgi:hypothetical protein
MLIRLMIGGGGLTGTGGGTGGARLGGWFRRSDQGKAFAGSKVSVETLRPIRILLRRKNGAGEARRAPL